MIQKIKEKIMQDRRIGRSSLEAFLEILKEVEAEYINKSSGHINKSVDCSTNADHIRQMSDEELTDWIVNHDDVTERDGRLGEEGILQWLKSPIGQREEKKNGDTKLYNNNRPLQDRVGD